MWTPNITKASIGVAFLLSGTAFAHGLATYFTVSTERELQPARLYDASSTRQILKQKDLNKYFEKEMEFSNIVDRFRRMSLVPNVDNETLAELLNALRTSPFYDSDKYTPMYKNLWIAQSMSEGESVKVHESKLHKSSPCLLKRKADKALSEEEKVFCTKQELIRDLYEALHNDIGIRNRSSLKSWMTWF